MLTIIMLGLVFACVALLYAEGLWGNTITLFNVVTSALLATNFYEPLARQLEKMEPSYTFFWDFLAIWFLFAVFAGVMRAVTDLLSRTKVRFLGIVDTIGGVFFSFWVGWVMVCFTMMTLHMAPLSREFFAGGFKADTRMVLGMAPDRQWLAFTQSVSRGVFCRGLSPAEVRAGKYGDDPEHPDEKALAVFDRQAEFLPKYRTIRGRLQTFAETRNAFRVPGRDVVPSR